MAAKRRRPAAGQKPSPRPGTPNPGVNGPKSNTGNQQGAKGKKTGNTTPNPTKGQKKNSGPVKGKKKRK